MKKLLMLLALMFVLIMAACGQEEENTEPANDENTTAGEGENVDGEESTELTEKELQGNVLVTYLDVAKSVRVQQKDINAYLAELANPEAEAATLETLKADAIVAAEEAATTIDGFTVEGLDADTTAKFEEALVDVKAAYDEYATALTAEEVDVTDAEAKITEANDKLTVIFEEVGLTSTPNLAEEIN
ncbi:hypothetical protein NC661_18210 [Aquibacillus koreensis]|uniref:Lipoprotein n=1 Tax=Aquibacillus koreensis TaxID=279446 RepID=A0A9X4ALB2_9BACI|nr:hypothetical protein [Aquibacillus koreensis]MCT2535453.1 hypothetical protein [Aquibacillus koreensis]MDC3422288.1 hypothetical protein [Aquibacillus koreensis]